MARTAAPRSAGLPSDLATFTRGTAGRGNWGHPGLTRILRGVSAAEATWKPSADTHSIWEEVNHIAYWSEDVVERLEGPGRSRKQAWPEGAGGEAEWRLALNQATRLHARLVKLIEATTPRRLARIAPRSTRHTHTQLILGCVSHIAYHVGQIALLRKLYRHARESAGSAV